MQSLAPTLSVTIKVGPISEGRRLYNWFNSIFGG
jgi:hypothetical protein